QALDESYIKPAEQEVSKKQQQGKLPLRLEELERVDRDQLQKGLDFYERFAEANRSNQRLEGEIGKAYQRAGFLHFTLGQLDKAEIAMGKATVILERLSQEFPGTPEYTRTLVNNYHWLGHVLEATGRLEKAEEVLRQNWTVSTKLVDDFPTVED